MAYTGTKAQTGLGIKLAIANTTPVPVGEVQDISINGRKLNFEDATNMDSSAEEVIATIPSPGEWDIAMNRVSSDAGQQALEAAFEAMTLLPFTVTFPKAPGQTTTGDKYAFNAYVESFDFKAGPKKIVSGSLKLKVTNAITYTAGS